MQHNLETLSQYEHQLIKQKLNELEDRLPYNAWIHCYYQQIAGGYQVTLFVNDHHVQFEQTLKGEDPVLLCQQIIERLDACLSQWRQKRFQIQNFAIHNSH